VAARQHPVVAPLLPRPRLMIGHMSHPPLRLLLVTDGETIPRWLCKCIEEVEQSRAATFVLVVQTALAAERRSVRRFLFWLYKNMDRYLFRRYLDALAPINLRSALPNCRVLARADLRSAGAGSQPVNTPLARTLQEERIDVALDPFALMPDGCFAELFRYGVWSTTFGQSGDPSTQSAPGFWEVTEGRPTTEARLCIQLQDRDKALSLYASVASTDRRSVSRNNNHICWKIAAAVARKVRALWEDPAAFLERLEATAPFEVANRPLRPPGNLQMVRAWTLLIRRYTSDKWRTALHRERWELAYQRGVGHPLDIGTFERLVPPMDRFWADPFPIQVGNDYYIFHEEALFSTNRGSIVLTVVDGKGNCARPIPVLEKDYHLSYPLVFQWDGDFFMMPETAAHHQVELYHCVSFPSHWKLERVLLPGVTAFDPTPAFLFGQWWLFANIPAPGAGMNDELHAFHADSPLGPWTPHRNNPVKSDVRSARPAGRIFEKDGHFYRPAQDCSKRYGHAVSINRILQLDPETYEEVEVDRIIPRWGPHVTGVHTFNLAGNMTVIDCLVRRKKF
jgi:hypothetical protein